MGDFPYVEWLAREYKRSAEISGHWTDYVKAHGLANFCVAKDCRESRHLVYEIEDSWYNGRHPLSFKEHQQLIDLHNYKLRSYRDETSLNYKQLETEVARLKMSDVFGEENLSSAEKLSHRIFETSQKCSEGLVKVSEDIIKSSVQLLQNIGLNAPCRFAVIGLGSIAKGEATPYSDLEYGFIVEREDAEYFENLAVDSYFRIGNLCETPLKTFDITELKVPKGCPPIITENIPAGYRIDGLTKNAGNIPTGNGREGSKTLTLTVDKLMELYKTSAVAPFAGLADLSDMLSSTVVIYTNEGETSQLHRDFVLARTAFEETKDEIKTVVNKKRFQSFSSDINSYTFLPEFAKFQPPGNLNIKVKTDIFRYPTLLANNIKMLMGWNLQYSWQVFLTLRDQGMLSKENYRYLNIVLAFSIYLRTSTYLNQGSQVEFLSLVPTSDKSSLSPATTMFVNLGCLLVPIKQSVMRSVEGITPQKGFVSAMVISIFRNIKVSRIDFLQRAEILYFTGNYYFAVLELKRGLGKHPGFMKCKRFLAVISRRRGDIIPAEKYVGLCGYLLYYTENYHSAISYLEWLINNKKEDLGLLKLLTANCKKEVGDYQGAKRLANEAKEHLSQEGGSYTVDDDHKDVWLTYATIGVLFREVGEPEEALEYFQKSINMNVAFGCEVDYLHQSYSYNNLGIICCDLGKYALGLEYHMKSLDIRKAIHGATTNHPDIADVYCNIGIAYRGLGNTTKALEWYMKSLNMRKVIYGGTTNHKDIADNYLNIGNIYMDQGKHELSLEYHFKAINIMKSAPGANTNHPDIATGYCNIGNAYRGLRNYTLSLEYHKKSLNMRKDIYGATAKHPYISNSYHCIGIVYYDLGNYTLSLEYQTKALDMLLAIYGSASNHPRIVLFRESIAATYEKLRIICLIWYTVMCQINKVTDSKQTHAEDS